MSQFDTWSCYGIKKCSRYSKCWAVFLFMKRVLSNFNKCGENFSTMPEKNYFILTLLENNRSAGLTQGGYSLTFNTGGSMPLFLC